MVASKIFYALGYRFYGRFLARRVFRLDDSRPTPAHTHTDGVDYVPTRPGVLFGHHFSSICAAGPIVGPALAGYLIAAGLDMSMNYYRFAVPMAIGGLLDWRTHVR